MARGFVYLVAVMDWFSRRALDWRLSITMETDFCVETLQEAMARHGQPEIFNTDQGVQCKRCSGASLPLLLLLFWASLRQGAVSAVIMFDVNDDAKIGSQRIELLTGPERRQRWSAEEKARIVQESLVPGARMSDVARRWQLCSQQVFG